MRLADGKLIFQMKTHYPSVEAAKEPIARFLRGWEVDFGLHFGRDEMKFVYEDANVIDRKPPPGEAEAIVEAGTASASFSAPAATIHVTRFEYPNPPQGFCVTPDVETMWHRYQGYLDGREPLAAMAYFCLTLLEAQVDGTGNKIGRNLSIFGIHREVRDKLGRLTAEVGDSESARKFKTSSRDFTKPETAWIEAAVKAMIRRKGEHDYDDDPSSLTCLTMKDLPQL